MNTKTIGFLLLSQMVTFAAFASQNYEATINQKYLLQVTVDSVSKGIAVTEKSVYEQSILGESQFFCETDATFDTGTAHVKLTDKTTGAVVQSYDVPIKATADAQYEVKSKNSPCNLFWKKNLSSQTPIYFDFQPIAVGKDSLTIEWYLGPEVQITGVRSKNTYVMNKLDYAAGDISIITHIGMPTTTTIIPVTEH